MQPYNRWMDIFYIVKDSRNHAFFQTDFVVRSYYSYQLWYLLVFKHVYIEKHILYLTTPIPAILFFYGNVIISWEHMKRSICQGLWVYFTTLIAVIQYNKRSVVDSKIFEGYCGYLSKAIVAMLYERCLFIPQN